MSKVEVNQVTQQCGTTLTVGGGACKTAVVDATTVTLGRCGGTVSLASGATQSGFGRTGTVDWITTIKVTGDSPITGVTGKGYFLNTTSGGITINLPTSPSAGDIVSIKDYARTFGTNEVIVGRGGSNMDGLAADTSLGTNGLSVTFIYMDAAKGWSYINEVTTSSAGATYIAACGGNTTITCGNYKTHIFTGPGALCVSSVGNPSGSDTVEYLVVAGGGAAGGDGPTSGGGGGGAGGFRTYSSLASVSPLNGPAAVPVSVSPYPVTIGGGGAGAPCNTSVGASGTNSIFSTITSAGGGGGGSTCSSPNGDGAAGGSGGGGAARLVPQSLSSGGAGNTPPVSPSQGFPGGTGGKHCSGVGAGGGGGAGAAAADQVPTCTQYGKSGGDGSYIHPEFFGPTAPSYGQTPTPLAPNGRYFAGGGGGGSGNISVPAPATPLGGAGGGGIGGTGGVVSTAGGVNTGGGGGGGGHTTSSAGGSGVVIIRYRFQSG